MKAAGAHTGVWITGIKRHPNPNCRAISPGRIFRWLLDPMALWPYMISRYLKDSPSHRSRHFPRLCVLPRQQDFFLRTMCDGRFSLGNPSAYKACNLDAVHHIGPVRCKRVGANWYSRAVPSCIDGHKSAMVGNHLRKNNCENVEQD